MSDIAAELEALADRVVARTLELGADEVAVSASQGTHVTLVRRGGMVESATEATTRGLVLSLQANGRHTSNSTSDLRPEALERFLERSVRSAELLEPEPAYALPDAALCGRGSDPADLELFDPAWDELTADSRSELLERLEDAVIAAGHHDDVASCAAHLSDASAHSARVMSNGFRDSLRGGWFTMGGEATLKEGDKRPEATAFFVSRFLADLPEVDVVGRLTLERVRQRLGASAAPSGTWPMVVENRLAAQILGILGGPLSGAALHHGRSCLAGKLESRIASPLLTVIDDPTIPRGLASRPWDGDGLRARPRAIIEEGVLRSFNIGVYYGRKLDMAPTSGSRSNWVVKPGARSWVDVARELPQAILVTSFLGGNSNSSTGDFSYGIRGVLLEHGEPVRPLSEMNVSGNILQLLQQLVAVGDDPWPWSSVRTPTMVFEGVSFSGT